MYESKILLPVIYNTRVEKIKINDLLRKNEPQSIHFDISESLSGYANRKLVTIKPERVQEGAKQAFHLELDFDDECDWPRLFETELEKFNKHVQKVDETPLNLSDFVSGHYDPDGVARFAEELQERVA